ncbi:Serine/threonine-protein kinase PknB [Rubripirellula amarantea]|uniref:Serine/threonine-protein kinase PknB n=1 Tax=Rubripirellula amarantea TaxID=2527999 RepID=A0A5C5WMK7_9BACT|nr:serine/threonine-protein kinase [Rubripirellula amarantea]TWT51243.1 Serine/threonine-protein kinase PknB [Rubripirellula amarantea]
MQVSLCPSDETLVDLVHGRLGELQESPVVEHVQQCEECRGKLAKIESDSSDSLLQQLRQSESANPFMEEPDCDWATSLALGAINRDKDDDPHAEPFALPMDLGDYRLLDAVAHGGMGIVYRAEHLRLGRDVAVKIISGKRLSDKRATQRFEAEMRALGQLSHPNIVSALDARELSGQPVLIMEYVDGLDLSQIVQRLGPLSPEAVAAIGRAVAAALEYANRNGLVHRDVKPSNIMLNRDGEVKLLDLGLARFQLTQGSQVDGTATGLALGTADYMSPEQIHDARDVDIRSDLYSLGCTLLKLLTGSAPYDDANHATNFAKLTAHVSPDPITVPDPFRGRSSQLSAIIEGLVAKDRADRPSSAQDVSLALQPLAHQADLAKLVQFARTVGPLQHHAFSQPNANINSRSDESWPSRWLLVALAAGGIPVGLLLGTWLTIQRSDGSVNRISLPENSSAIVDSNGNVDVSVTAGTTALPQAHRETTSGDSNAIANMPRSKSRDLAIKGVAIATLDGDREVVAAMHAVTNAETPIYRGYPYNAWMNLFEKDRNVDIAVSAATALVQLADTKEQKGEVARALLKRCRAWGGRILSDGSEMASPKWMNMMVNQYPNLMSDSDVEFEYLLDELEHGNSKSRTAVEMILSMQFDSILPMTAKLSSSSSSDTMRLQLIHALAKHAEVSSDSPGSTEDLAMAMALSSGIPYADLPASLQKMSKMQWMQVSEMPTREVIRTIDFGSYQFRLKDAAWLPYWQTLADENRKPRHVFYQLFEDQVHFVSIYDAASVLAVMPRPADGDVTALKQFLVQRLADSDFDERGSDSKVWPALSHWLVRADLLTVDKADRMLAIISETEDKAIDVIGRDLYVLNPPRTIAPPRRGGTNAGISARMSGYNLGRESDLSDEQNVQIKKALKEGCEHLAQLLGIEIDFAIDYRIPGGTDGRKNFINQGGMF